MLALYIAVGLLTLSEVCLGAVTSAEKAAILDQHNQLRASEQWATNMQTMYWDDGLAAEAQALADTCVSKHNKVSTARFSSAGQNIAEGHDSWTSAVNDWYSEKKDLIFGVEKKGGDEVKVGHYTQIVWATTNNIGCGFNDCSGKRIYVCNYGPAGNIKGSLYNPYNMGNEGQSDCGASIVDSKLPTLCDTKGEVCLNDATMNLQTGECKCFMDLALFDKDSSCKVDCSKADEHPFYSAWCLGTAPGTDDIRCKEFYNVKYQFCPTSCGLCP